MTDLYHGYDMRDWWDKSAGFRGADLVAHHIKRHGVPPSILINKVDSESIPQIPKEIHTEISRLVLPHSILLEIQEVENEA